MKIVRWIGRGFVALVLLTGLFVLPFLPETKDKPLPDE